MSVPGLARAELCRGPRPSALRHPLRTRPLRPLEWSALTFACAVVFSMLVVPLVYPQRLAAVEPGWRPGPSGYTIEDFFAASR